MNPNALVNSGIRFVVLAIVQAFLFKQITLGFGGGDVLFVFVYPIFILLLPLRMPRPMVIFTSFCLGLTIDLFYETLGMHAAAATFAAYVRAAILQFIQPQEKYNIKAHPTPNDLGWPWFIRYTGLLLFFHLLFFFSVQAFTPVYWWSIVIKTIFSFLASYLLVLLLILVFNPKT
ncbi:MAG: hypothetical protein AAFQ37_01525 [Bacteroidota bacterium]